jgi:hypothetical protein
LVLSHEKPDGFVGNTVEVARTLMLAEFYEAKNHNAAAATANNATVVQIASRMAWFVVSVV